MGVPLSQTISQVLLPICSKSIFVFAAFFSAIRKKSVSV